MGQAIARAIPKDSHELSDLTYRSKAHWGYSAEQLEKWRDDLQITSEYIRDHDVWLVRINEKIAGYYSFSIISATTLKLDNIFLEPLHIGAGLGSLLMKDFLDKATGLGVTTITLDAEPNAEPFYQKFGFKTVGQLKSTIPGRFLPFMKLSLSE